MPRPTPAKPSRRAPAPAPVEGTVRFAAINWVLLGVALICIVGGYILLDAGSTVAAPLLLVLGYGVVVPLGIIR